MKTGFYNGVLAVAIKTGGLVEIVKVYPRDKDCYIIKNVSGSLEMCMHQDHLRLADVQDLTRHLKEKNRDD